MIRYLLLLISGLFALTGCARKVVRTPTPLTNLSADNSYIDLAPGSRLRIVIPVMKNGDTKVKWQPQRTTDNTIELSATNLLGYQVAEYLVDGRPHEQVRLRFISAQITRDGKTEPLPGEPDLPFSLPDKSEHVRLIYYIRASRSDHNMAIAGSKNMDALVAFTKRLEQDPLACGSVRDVFCSWVPAEVAVRPE